MERNRGRTTEAAARDFDRIARTSADEAARQIVRAIVRSQPRLLIGMDARLIDRVQRLMPAGYVRLVATALAAEGFLKSAPDANRSGTSSGHAEPDRMASDHAEA